MRLIVLSVLLSCSAVFGSFAAPLSGFIPKDARERLLAEAESYIRVPYRYGGIARTGVDCSGLVYISFQQALGITVPRTVAALYSWAEKIPANTLEAGDLVFFNTTGSVSHVGIYTGSGTFIHAASEGPSTGVIISSLSESYWRRTFIGAGRALPSTGAPASDPFLGDGAEGFSEPDRIPSAGNRFQSAFSAAMSWDPLVYNEFIRGMSFKAGIFKEYVIFGRYFSPGIEIRGDWDKTLGVFRFPLTLSLAFSDSIRIFAGPSLSLGEAQIETVNGIRNYDAEPRLFSCIGISWLPVSFNIGSGRISLMGEAAWQSYARAEGFEPDWTADLTANLRLSAGLHYSFSL